MTEWQIWRKRSDLIDIIFPSQSRAELRQLWTFVQTAQALTAHESLSREKLDELEWAWHGGEIDDSKLGELAARMQEIAKRHQFDEAWMEAFFASLRMDLPPARHYETLSQLDEYIGGIAEAPALMAARICGLDARCDAAVRAQSSALQLLEFLRNLKGFIGLDRQYIPQEMLREIGFAELTAETANENESAFTTLVRRLIDEYRCRQTLADAATKTLPLRQRLPLQLVADRGRYIARLIEHAPLVVWERPMTPPYWLLRLFVLRRRLL